MSKFGTTFPQTERLPKTPSIAIAGRLKVLVGYCCVYGIATLALRKAVSSTMEMPGVSSVSMASVRTSSVIPR